MSQSETRDRLARQLATTRRAKRWRLSDLARRTGRNIGRLSEMENGKANSTLDSLAEAGAALGLALVFVPREKLAEVLALIGQAPEPIRHHREVPSMFDELFVRVADEEDDDHAHP